MDIGKVAQDTVKLWAEEEGIVANEAHDDKKGWDLIFEFRAPSSRPTDVEKRPAEFKCLVQVKATRGRRRYEDVKLTNWEHLAKSALPCFYCILEYPKVGKSPDRAYIVHVDDEWIETVLRRLRSLPTAATASMHRRTLRLKWGEKEKLNACDGQSLVGAIHQHCGEDPKKYVDHKHHTISNVGYPERRFQTSMVFEGSSREIHDRLVDAFLGEGGPIPAKTVTLTESRFGIEKPFGDMSPDGDYEIEFHPKWPDANCIVRAYKKDGAEICDIECSARSPFPLFDVVKPTALKHAFVNRHMRIDTVPDSGKMNFAFHIPPGDQRFRLWEVGAVAALAYAFANHELDKLEYDREGNVLSVGIQRYGTELDASVVEAIHSLYLAYVVARNVVLPREIEATMFDIASARNNLLILREFVDNERESSAEFVVSGPEKPTGPNVAVVVCIPFRLADTLCVTPLIWSTQIDSWTLSGKDWSCRLAAKPSSRRATKRFSGRVTQEDYEQLKLGIYNDIRERYGSVVVI